MKGHRKHRETGGVNQAEADLDEKPEARTNAKTIDSAAEERKRGGHVKPKCGGGMARARGGKVKMVKHVGEVRGEPAKSHAGRKPRKSGGRTGADTHPFSSARHGTPAPGRREEMEFE